MDIDIDVLSLKNRETYTRHCIKVDKKVWLENVILSAENQKKIQDFMKEQRNAEKLRAAGFEPVNRLLLYGASGTGKTYMSQAIANELGIPMLHIDVSQFTADRMAAGITDIFELADELGRVLIFLDECDSICWARDDGSNEDSAAVRRANNVLFQKLDQMKKGHVFISATNLYDKLDPAFRRRFNIEMKFIAPRIRDFGAAVAIFVDQRFKYEKNMPEQARVVVNHESENYHDLSYFKIKDWVTRVEKAAVLADRTVIHETEVYDMLMQAMRIELINEDGQWRLHQYSKWDM